MAEHIYPWQPDSDLNADYWTPSRPEKLSLDVEWDNAPRIVGTLLGADGEPLSHIYDRASVPFGFQLPDSD